MQHNLRFWRRTLLFSSALVLGATIFSAAAADDLVPLEIKLPNPAFKGTPKDMPIGPNVEPLPDKPRPAMMVPKGMVNLALGKTITSSLTNIAPEDLKKITDGDKEAYDDSVVLLKKGTQYIQFDLGAAQALYAIVVWHAHNVPKVYHDVIVQVSDDATFKDGVQTLYNNDTDNSSGLGVGTNREYFETAEGRLIDAKGAKARYVRFYTKGSSESVLNEYTEVEIYGRPGS